MTLGFVGSAVHSVVVDAKHVPQSVLRRPQMTRLEMTPRATKGSSRFGKFHVNGLLQAGSGPIAFQEQLASLVAEKLFLILLFLEVGRSWNFQTGVALEVVTTVWYMFGPGAFLGRGRTSGCT